MNILSLLCFTLEKKANPKNFWISDCCFTRGGLGHCLYMRHVNVHNFLPREGHRDGPQQTLGGWKGRGQCLEIIKTSLLRVPSWYSSSRIYPNAHFCIHSVPRKLQNLGLWIHALPTFLQFLGLTKYFRINEKWREEKSKCNGRQMQVSVVNTKMTETISVG